MNLYPRLYSLALNKEARLFEKHPNGVEQGRFFQFRRSLFPWEEEEVHRLESLLQQGPTLCMDGADSIVWNGDSSGMFSVQSLNNLLEDDSGPNNEVLDLI